MAYGDQQQTSPGAAMYGNRRQPGQGGAGGPSDAYDAWRSGSGGGMGGGWWQGGQSGSGTAGQGAQKAGPYTPPPPAPGAGSAPYQGGGGQTAQPTAQPVLAPAYYGTPGMSAMYGPGGSSASTGPVGLELGELGAPGAWDGGYNAHYATPAVPAAAPAAAPRGSSAPPTSVQYAREAAAEAGIPQFTGGSVTRTSAGVQAAPGTVAPGGPGWSVSLPTLNPSWYASQKDANQGAADQNALGSRLGSMGYEVTGANQAAPVYGSNAGSAPLQTTPVAPIFSMPTDPAARNQRYNELLNQGYTDAQIATNPYFLTGQR